MEITHTVEDMKLPYQSPELAVVEVTSPQMICASNESIVPGGETDWTAPDLFGNDFDLLF